MSDIWTSAAWPNFTYDPAATEGLLAEFSEYLGEARGLHAGLSDAERRDIKLRGFTDEVVSSFAIEGESLDTDAVRNSVIKAQISGDINQAVSRFDAIIEMMLDARNGALPIDERRLCNWHRLLFHGIEVEDLGQWRGFEMVIDNPNAGGTYQPVPAEFIAGDMADFIAWMNEPSTIPTAIRAALAHLWFASVHPFSDGNGQIGRGIIDYVFAGSGALPFSLSQQIQRDPQAYFEALQAGRQESRGAIDATPFVVWFLGALIRGAKDALQSARFLNARNQFLQRVAGSLSARQEGVLRQMFAMGPQRVSEGLSARSYAEIGQVASATATRDLTALVDAGVLVAGERGGRSQRYLFPLGSELNR